MDAKPDSNLALSAGEMIHGEAELKGIWVKEKKKEEKEEKKEKKKSDTFRQLRWGQETKIKGARRVVSNQERNQVGAIETSFLFFLFFFFFSLHFSWLWSSHSSRARVLRMR